MTDAQREIMRLRRLLRNAMAALRIAAEEYDADNFLQVARRIMTDEQRHMAHEHVERWLEEAEAELRKETE